MIIQTGMRTDIPAFYSEWFVNRIQEGFVCTRNPYYPNQVTKYSLSPDVVDIIGFCTKNPAPMLDRIEVLSQYGQYWFVTITPYGREIEPNVPSKKMVMGDFIRLSKIVGADSLGWRYDPIFLTEAYSINRHIHDFEEIAKRLHGYTHSCVISFIDLYEKTKRSFPQASEVKKADRITLGKTLIEIAKKCDMTVRPCCEGDELASYGADCSGCLTQSILEQAIHCRLNIPKSKIKSQRSQCTCIFGRDIGQYNTCGHLCKYCYANADRGLVMRNIKLHDPKSPFLIGNSMPDDVIHIAQQESWADNQLTLFD